MELDLNLKSKTRLSLDPTTKEAMALNNMAVDFVKDLDRDPSKAKITFRTYILPHMMKCLRSLQILDDQLVGAAEQNALLLKSNAVLIDLLKQNGIDMPNFAQIQREVESEFNRESI